MQASPIPTASLSCNLQLDPCAKFPVMTHSSLNGVVPELSAHSRTRVVHTVPILGVTSTRLVCCPGPSSHTISGWCDMNASSPEIQSVLLDLAALSRCAVNLVESAQVVTVRHSCSLQHCRRSHSQNLKLKICKTIILPVFQCGCET